MACVEGLLEHLAAGELLRHLVEQQLRRDGGLSYVQFRVLAAVIEAGGGARMTDLADRLVVSQGGLTYQVGLLEKAGLIRRRRAEKDERSTVVMLSDDGSTLMDTVLPGHVALVEHALFAPLTPDDVATLDEVLSRSGTTCARSRHDRPHRGANPRSGLSARPPGAELEHRDRVGGTRRSARRLVIFR